MKNKVSLIVTALLLTACGSPKYAPNYYTHQTECIGVELDGSQILRAWANTGQEVDAIEAAKRNAIKEVLFGANYAGKPLCDNKPLLPVPNTLTNNQGYFAKFFQSNGEYFKYAVLNEVDGEKDFKKNPDVYIKAGFVIRVYRAALKQKMADDGISK
ncbi:hypothetical protein AAFN85_01205 [Mucilaginibacter sp. CAU 1740]|uniref:hypothetical protein n=1 Tax=Mucilaginibacter sp. CAU 1740 TaxID=3140365 RepID=UPI00325BB4B3